MRSRYSYYSYLEGQDQHAAAGYMVSVKAISPTAKPKPSTHLKPYNPPPQNLTPLIPKLKELYPHQPLRTLLQSTLDLNTTNTS